MKAVFRRIDFLRRKFLQDMRDKLKGPFYEMDGVVFLVPSDAPPGERRGLAKGTYEAQERVLVQKYLLPDVPTVELGGCYGIVSNTIRRKLNAGVVQVVVEANPALISTCAYNLSQAGALEKTHLLNAALGYSDDGQVRFVLGSGHHNSFVSDTAEQEAGVLSVPAVSLGKIVDEYLEGGAFNLVCDIEGAELELLRQENDVFAKCQRFICEIHPEFFASKGTTEKELFGLIEQAGLGIVEEIDGVIVAVRADQ